MKSLYILVLFLTFPVFSYETIVGYDCHKSTSHLEIGLTASINCTDSSPPPTISSAKIQLIQKRTFENVPFIQCYGQLNYKIWYCGQFLGHNKIVHEESLIDSIPYHNCKAFHSQRYAYPKDHIYFTTSVVGGVGLKSGFLAGDMNDNSCNGIEYIHPPSGKFYNRAVVHLTYEIRLRTGYAVVRHDSPEAKLVLPSGSTCMYPGYCFDGIHGHTYWITSSDKSCNTSDYKVLFEGIVQKVVSLNPHKIEFLSLSASERKFYAKVVSNITICGKESYSIQHPNLFVSERTHDEFVFSSPSSSLDPSDIDIFSYLGMSLSNLHYNIQQNTISLYKSLKHELCVINSKATQNLLSLAKVDPKDFGYLYFEQPGHYGVVRGEIIYLKRCLPVVTEYRQTKNCFQDIPVFYNNISWFLTPRSRLLVKEGTVMECSNVLPPKYFIDGTWYQPGQGLLAQAKEPVVLDVQYLETWSFEDDLSIYSKGIYTSKEKESYESMILSPVTTQAKQQNLISILEGKDTKWEGMKINEFISPDEFHLLQQDYHGSWVFGVLGVGVLLTNCIIFLMIYTIGNCIGSLLHVFWEKKWNLIFVAWIHPLITWVLFKAKAPQTYELSSILPHQGEININIAKEIIKEEEKS